MDMAAENTPYLTNTLLLKDGETPHLSLWEEEEEKEEEKEEEEGVDEDEDEEDDQYWSHSREMYNWCGLVGRGQLISTFFNCIW